MRLFMTLLLLMLSLGSLYAQWSADPAVNTVLDKPGDQRAPLMATDGKGGAIVAWNEDRGVFANWVDKYGFRQWGAEGMRITPVGRIAALTNMVSDGAGGAVIVWEDFTKAREVGDEVVSIIETEIFAQRVDSSGQLLWDPGGVGVRTKLDSTDVGAFGLVTSGQNDFVVTWVDDRKHPYPRGSPVDFYAQKIDGDGNLLWESNGILITVRGSIFNIRHRVVTDGAGGALLARFGEGNQNTVVEQISADGELVWPPGGVPVHTGGAFEIDTDGQGGAVVAGVFFPGGGFVGEVRVQRISNNGELLWGEKSVVLTQTADVRSLTDIVHDGNGAAIVTWSEEREGQRKRFLQRITDDGSQMWQSNGIPLIGGGSSLMNDGQGGVIIVRSELINDPVKTYRKSLQKVDSSGIAQWGEAGITYQIRETKPGGYLSFVSDMRGGIILIWDEFNLQTSWDIVMQQVNRNGVVGEVVTSVQDLSGPGPEDYVLFQNYPNPFNPETQIRFVLRESGSVSLKIYDLSGREVVTLVNEVLPLGEHKITWDGRDQSNKLVASGIYFYRLQINEFSAVRKMVFIR